VILIIPRGDDGKQRINGGHGYMAEYHEFDDGGLAAEAPGWQALLEQTADPDQVDQGDEAARLGAPVLAVDRARRIRRLNQAEKERKRSVEDAWFEPPAVPIVHGGSLGQAAQAERLSAPKVGADAKSLADPPPLVWDRRRMGRRPVGASQETGKKFAMRHNLALNLAVMQNRKMLGPRLSSRRPVGYGIGYGNEAMAMRPSKKMTMAQAQKILSAEEQ
jgi:hypothetical protein